MGAMKDLMIEKMNKERKYIKFFSRITADHWTAKNKLQEAAHELAYEMDRKLIPGNEVLKYIGEFERRIHDLESDYPNCKPLDFSWHKGYTERWAEIWIYCNGVFRMSLIEVKEDE